MANIMRVGGSCGSSELEIISSGKSFSYSHGDWYFDQRYQGKNVVGIVLGGQVHTTYIELTTPGGIIKYDSQGNSCKIYANLDIRNVTRIYVRSNGADDIKAYTWFTVICAK